MTNKLLSITKWTATNLLVISVALNGLGIYPWGPIVAILGGILWLIAACYMNDMPLIMTNLLMTSVGIFAVGYNYYWSA